MRNPNPFTDKQQRFLNALQTNLNRMDDPDRDLIELTTFKLAIEPTRKYGPIPKIIFQPNSLAVKEEIMEQAGYVPVAALDHWRAKRDAAASAFDKTWDSIMFQLVKAGKRLAFVNQMFSGQGQVVSPLIQAIQQCIELGSVRVSVPAGAEATDNNRPSSYADELANLK